MLRLGDRKGLFQQAEIELAFLGLQGCPVVVQKQSGDRGVVNGGRVGTMVRGESPAIENDAVNAPGLTGGDLSRRALRLS